MEPSKVTDALTVSIIGLVGAAWSRPLAQAVGVDMPWFAQFGLCGLFGSLLWWALARTLPQVSADSKEAAIRAAVEHKEGQVEAAKVHAEALAVVCEKLDAVCDESKLVRAAIDGGNGAQLALLRTVIHNQQGAGP